MPQLEGLVQEMVWFLLTICRLEMILRKRKGAEMEKKLNLAIMGAGKIARTMGETVMRTDIINGYAVASRSLSRAVELADAYHFEKAYGSYEEMLADEKVDLVYIATPHALHAEQMIQCINAGKNILCEKAFCITAEEARRVLELAEQKKVFVAEAIWTRYMPMAKTITDFVKSGKLGTIHAVTSNLCYPVWNRERVHARHLGGGALLDVGIYNLTFASLILGFDVADIKVSACIDPQEGTDRYETVTLTYPDGVVASLYSSIVGPSDRRAVIYGSEGYALVENVNDFKCLQFYDARHQLVEEFEAPPEVTGYEYEVASCVDSIRKGLIEPPEATHRQSIDMMELMDRIRKEMGLTYPNDEQ